jgi:hypothetical protein
MVRAEVGYSDTGVNIAVTLEIRKNGVAQAFTDNRSSATANQIWTGGINTIPLMAAADYIELFVTGSANTSVQANTRLFVTRLA